MASATAPSPNPSLTPEKVLETAAPVAPTAVQTNLTQPKEVVLAQGLVAPDDLALSPDGSIFVSDVTTGAIQQVRQDGSVQTVLVGLSEPEGMVFLPDGALVIAEQGKNRLVRYDFKTRQVSPFLNLKNPTGQAGVDGIALDAHEEGNETILVPDSPVGVVRRISLDASSDIVLATGFVRPTGAWAAQDGSILVVDENSGWLARIRVDGSIERLARLSIPDDVVADAQGNIFVVTLGDHAIHKISGSDYHDTILRSDFIDPQGLLITPDGNLIVADQGHHRIVEITLH